MKNDNRPDPDEILKVAQQESKTEKSGRLRIFLGMSAGVGKTYAMLKAAHQRQSENLKVAIGIVETHGRSETAALLDGLTVIPQRKMEYRGKVFEEMDLDSILEMKPDLVIIDELPHSNIPGSRHEKRYQDVLEVLDAGIDVYTAVNIQHLDSRKDAVEGITGITIRETVPDSLIERAALVEVVDIAPVELLRRLADGKVYLGDKAKEAASRFFREDKLTALREMALRLTAERVDQDLRRFSATKNDKPWQTNERLLVAVSHSPYSETLIRATRRLAYNLEAPWIAVHIDTGHPLSDEDQAQLVSNLNLAKDLCAEVITVADTDLTRALERISRQRNVTQIVVGRSGRSWWRSLLEGGSLLNRLIGEAADVDIHVIRTEIQKSSSGPRTKIFPLLRSYLLKEGFEKYWNTLWFMIATTLVSAVLEPLVGYRTVGFVYLLAVLVVGVFGNIGSVLLAAAFSTLIWDFVFIPPKFTFAIAQLEDITLCAAYFAVAIITGLLTQRIRRQEKLMRDRQERVDVLYQVLKDISESKDKEEFIDRVRERMGELLGAECSVVLKGRDGALDFGAVRRYSTQINEHEKAVALWTFQNQKPAGWSTDTLSQARALYLPLSGVSEPIGVFIFKPERKIKKLGLEKESLLNSVVGQLGVSLERHFLSRRILEAKRLEDSEKLHQTILSSISHELRTPLTAILGAASALDGDLAISIRKNGERLNRVIENLLDMSRLSAGPLALNLEWHDIEDLIGVVVRKLSLPLASHKINIDVVGDAPLLRLDFRMFEHALSNLALNATQYSEPGTSIDLRVYHSPGHLVVEVADQGVGVPEASVAQIFEKFYRVPGSPPGGTGLGLSIVRNIVELHGGTIRYEKNEPKGSRFIIEMPVEKQPDLPEDFGS